MMGPLEFLERRGLKMWILALVDWLATSGHPESERGDPAFCFFVSLKGKARDHRSGFPDGLGLCP